jgi:hypothetical protein
MKFFVPFVLFAALMVGALLTGGSAEAGLVRRDCCCKKTCTVVVVEKCDCSGRRHPLRDALKELRKSKCCGEVAAPTCSK